MPTAAAIELNTHSSVLAPGAILQSRYRIIRQLGKGGMGAVYEAVDQRLDATVALKETFSVDNRLRRQFEQEARLLAQLHHPALPRVSDYFTEGSRAFLVMQFISGVDLAEIIAKQPGPFPRNQVVAWADQLLDALIYLHTRDRQVIHRDIKPHNLKLTANGQIALLDFGLAKAESADASAANSSVSIFGYTRRYAPLEQIQDQGTSPQSDIYALGATLYHLLTGIKPSDAVARAGAHVNSRPDPLKPADEVHAAVGPELAAILCKAMAQNPEERYASASDFREALWRVGRSEARLAESVTEVAADKPASAAIPTTTATPVSQTERVGVADPFDNYSILKPARTAWLLPVQKRGPNAFAGILFILFTVGALGLYGYRLWIESSAPVKESNQTKTASEQRVGAATLVHQGKADKSHDNASATGGSRAPLGDGGSGNETATERRPSKVDVANSSALVSAPRDHPQPQRVAARRKLNIPNPRLPNSELKANDPAPSIQRLPVYAQPDLVMERQVLRAADGTQVVKFSDGTTRVFRPGEKSAHSGAPK